MSLLDNLASLDLSAVVNARATINTSSTDISLTLEGGAASSALGELGTAIDVIANGIDNPEQLLQPLLEALLAVAEPLKSEIPVGPWFESVESGIRLLIEIIEAINGDPKELISFITRSDSNDLIKQANKLVSEYTPVSLGDAAQLRQLIELVEGQMPSDPDQLAQLAIRILQPFEGRQLAELRTSVNAVLSASTSLAIPDTRLTGLTTSLQTVITAANTGDVNALENALSHLQQVRANTINSLRNDIAQINIEIGQLPITQMFAPMNAVGEVLNTAEQGTLQFMQKWQGEIHSVRTFLDNAEFDQVGVMLNSAFDSLEVIARQLLVEPVDEAVEKTKTWLRNLLAHLHLVEYRNQVTQFLASIAQQIEDANLDVVAKEAKKILDDIEQAISGDLVGSIQGVVNDLKVNIEEFIDTVIGSLETITQEINNIAAEAEAVLNQVEAVLVTFKQTIDQISSTIEQLGIEAATAQVIDALTTLRQTAETVLGSVSLPEAIRPAIDQLISEVENIDLNTVFEPAYEVANIDFSIPAEVTDGLDQAAEAIKNLIPDELITEIEAQVSSSLDVIRDFDPTTLLAGVTEKVTEAADMIRGLDPRPAVDSIRGPYVDLLNLLDEIHPDRILAPVIDVWDNLLGEINLQSPQDAIGSISSSINTAGETLVQQAISPITQMAPEGMLDMSDSTEPSDSNVANSTQAEDILPVKPGDVIRLLGYIPNKLREFIAELDETIANEFLGRLHSLGKGLSTDLRRIPDELMRVNNRLLETWDTMLLPIGPLQFEAQLAIEANFSSDQIDVNASLGTVASVRPGALRRELDTLFTNTFDEIHKTSMQLTSSAGNNMLYAINQLENNLLHGLTEDLDDFLAALDPEPIAAELDALIDSVLRRAPEVVDEIEDDLILIADRIERLIQELNPGTQAQKFLTVIEVLEEQVNLLDPRRLAAELTEIHQAIKNIFLAYDPAVFAQEVYEVIEAVADALQALDPATLLGDLADFDAIVQRVEDAVPTQALAGIDSSLEDVGSRLQELNPEELIAVINDLPDRIVESIERAVEALKAEILALLEAIKYASGNASASASASVSF